MKMRLLPLLSFLLYISVFSGVSRVFAANDIARPVIVKAGQTYLGGYQDLREEFIFSKKDFLEINIPENKVRIYKLGEIDNTFPILHKKDGLPFGLFFIQSKKGLDFSMDTGTYLPYALNYYGSCRIHGESYAILPKENGVYQKAECLALSDRDAKILYGSVEIGLPVLSIGEENREFPETKAVADFPEITARSFLVADIDSGLVLAEKNSDIPLPIASLTKLMTAVVVKEQTNLKNTILVKNWMLRPYGETEGLMAGLTYSLEQLYSPLLQESSNDAAEVLSSAIPGGSAIYAMNQRAKSIMMEKTGFVDAHGIDVANQATARDLFYLARHVAQNNPEIFEITKGVKPSGFSSPVFLSPKNKNLFIDEPGFIGGKTGYIIESKYNGLFVFSLPAAEGGSRRVAIIILGAPHWQTMDGNLKSETLKILAWLRRNYSTKNQ